jgi:hypothetical protein
MHFTKAILAIKSCQVSRCKGEKGDELFDDSGAEGRS